MKQPSEEGYCVAVIGAGAMGQGIVQVSVTGGMPTLLYDVAEGAAAKARDAVASRINRLAEKGKLTAEDAAAMAGRIEVVDSLDGIARADAVIEAVIEDEGIKKSLFRDIEGVVSESCLIASNTSSIPIASLASVCEHRERIAGMHFFNPVPLMALVEVVRAPATAPETVEAFTALGKRMGRTPVAVQDAPGFLVNLGGRAYSIESLRIAHDQIATPAQIDAVMRDCCGFRMGPFELMDLIGIDVDHPVSLIVCDDYMGDMRLRTSPLDKAMVDAGRYGRKTGIGHFRYGEKGQMTDPPSPDHVTDAAPASAVALAESDAGLEAFCGEVGLEIVSGDGAGVPVLAAPLGEDCTSVALRTGADHKRLVAIDLTGDTSKRVTLMTAPGADMGVRDGVAAALIASGRAVTAIKDSPGFIAQRMRAFIANLGCYKAEIGLAPPDDIDLAMKLALNYPLGPLEIVEDLGAKETLTILEQLQAITGEDRYRPTLWLKRRALLGLSIRTPA